MARSIEVGGDFTSSSVGLGRGGPSVHNDLRAGTNNGQMIGQYFEAVQRHSGAPMSPEWVSEQVGGTLPIGNEEEVAKLLEDRHVLVLVADRPGSGRWTAALRLLTSVPGEPLTIRRIRREAGDSFSMGGLRGRRRTGWILDLRDPEERVPKNCDLGHELLQTEDLSADGSYVVVLVRTELWESIGHGATSLAREPLPPEPGELFVSFLRSAGVTSAESWAAAPLIKEALRHLSPGQVRDQARALVLSYEQYRAATGREPQPDPDSKDLKAVTETAKNAVTGWIAELADWHSTPGRTSYDRNYLLLAAVLDGQPIEGVHGKISSLARAFGEKGEGADPLPGQQGPGLIQLARQIGAEPLPDGSLRFPGPGFPGAVVQYFWRDRPDLVDAFTTWSARLSVELREPQGSQLAERMAPWVLHHAKVTRSTRLLRQVAHDWSADRYLAPHVQNLLISASLDPEIGNLTRSAMGKWVVDHRSAPHFLVALAQVSQRLAPAHPTQMLRRLGDLAHSPQESVADAVGEAVDALWRDADLRARLHQNLTSWFNSEQPALRRVAISAFLHLALQGNKSGPPELLLHHSEVGGADWVVNGWRTVLEADEPTALARRTCSAWLDCAATQEASREDIFQILIRAVHDVPGDRLRGQRFLNLVRLGEHWLDEGEVLDRGQRDSHRRELLDRTQVADPHRPRSREDLEPRSV